MQRDDLLIISCGRSFLFANHMQFNEGQGYRSIHKYYSRLSLDINLADQINQFLSLVPLRKEDSNILLVSNQKVDIAGVNTHSLQKKETIKNNFVDITRRLRYEKAGLLLVDEEEIYYTDGDIVHRETLGIMQKDFLREILAKMPGGSLSESKLLNFLTSYIPIPQNSHEQHVSFLLGYAFGVYVSKRLNLASISRLIVNSEWLKVGFFDKTGFIYGINKYYPNVYKYSFDIYDIWKDLVGGIDEANEILMYLNSENFLADISVLFVDRNKVIVDTAGTKKEVYIVEDVQNIFTIEGCYSIENYANNYENTLLCVISRDKREQFLKYEKFINWYQLNNNVLGDYLALPITDELLRHIEIADDLIDGSQKDSYKEFDYYDMHSKHDQRELSVRVIEGEYVEEGDTLFQEKTGITKHNKYTKALTSGRVALIDRSAGWLLLERKKKFERKDYYYKKKADITRDISYYQYYGYKLNCIFVFGEKNLARLEKFEKGRTVNSYSAVWIRDSSELSYVLDEINTIQPRTIILPSVNYSEFDGLVGKDKRYLKMFNIVLVNGFGDAPYTKEQRKFLNLNSGKFIIIDPYLRRLTTIEEEGKFGALKAPYHQNVECKIFTIDDWNLSGKLIYNDEDSQIFKLSNGRVLDVAQFNLIKYSDE